MTLVEDSKADFQGRAVAVSAVEGRGGEGRLSIAWKRDLCQEQEGSLMGSY